MRWSRGLNRLWVVSAAVWIMAVLLFLNEWYFTLYDYLRACIVPPLVLYAIGAATWWAIRGWKKA